ncbi:hypothetical protein P153DRAFT_292698 [Dothidotthia symphoricarpi CBS 119687]|uniref:Uncharacterized protein n=1 Tax=Dothidotthia symphoricarpi CBS 119687 TaxID=1392245 RepID=A0A6A6AB96_9PLEO|nr:uncharacterized protein P153DRAFT_292698 [Dothidotthia symphoricarpi CBS 119687]KAF2128294.1 hypothetical protein P153DRAFT_292698 [Dothidotthia symphoricarpi CBS 119687]
MPRPRTSPSPPPATFTFTAGDFDYPHASTSPNISTWPRNISGLGSAIRNMRRDPRPAEQPTHPDEAVAATRRPVSAIRRRQLHRLLGPPRDSEPPNDLSRRPPTANPNRPRATPSERYLGRSQARIREQRAADMDSTDALIDSLTNNPLTNIFALSNASPHPPPQSHPVPFSPERRQAKRRKLDHDASTTSEYHGFKYGYKGQVVPGRLKMDILSCDGGEYRKDNPSGLYNVQNVLKNDKSVYCSESASCNILLKHIGEAPFALDKIVIRAPDRGFTAPVQEGLVFVSMSADHLLAGTSAYHLQYRTQSPLTSPTPSSPADDDDDNEQLSLQEAINDPTLWQRIRRASASSAQHPATTTHTYSYPTNEHDPNDDNENDICDDTASPAPPPFTVTTATSDDSAPSTDDEDTDIPSAAIIADRLRRESRWRAESDDDDDGDIIPRFGGLRRAPALDYSSYGEWRERREALRAAQLGSPSRIEPGGGDAGVIVPHARFFIKKNRHKITIRFQPAVSGRNVLLKLWSPMCDGNIDIESVMFYGYSGPRFFPATRVC